MKITGRSTNKSQIGPGPPTVARLRGGKKHSRPLIGGKSWRNTDLKPGITGKALKLVAKLHCSSSC